MKVKICGITNLEDALLAAEAGADALGFIFHPKSSRYILPDEAAKITRMLRPFVATVGVFVDATCDEVQEVVKRARLTAVQLHGTETPEYCASFSVPVIKAFRVADAESLQPLTSYNTSAWLLDSFVAGVEGGTGLQFNWDHAKTATALGKPIILAGGLTPENVASAVAHVRPYAVDVSSGTEAVPGKKDAAKVRAFIRAAKSFPVT